MKQAIEDRNDPLDPDPLDPLQQWSAGDPEELNTLLQSSLPWFRRRASHRLGDKMRRAVNTSDMVQEAVVRFLRYSPRFRVRSKGELRTLLARMLEFAFGHQARRQRSAGRSPEVVAKDPEEIGIPKEDVDRPSQAAMLKERQLWVRLGLELVGRDDREAIILHIWHGLSFPAMGQRLGISPDAARMRYERALARMARSLKGLRAAIDAHDEGTRA